MNRFKIQRKEPVYLGIVLIVAGIFLKRFVELTLVSDMQIEAPIYLALLYAFQFLAIVSGIWFLIKQPSIRIPSKTEIILPVFSILLTFFLLEFGARLWLRYLTTPEHAGLTSAIIEHIDRLEHLNRLQTAAFEQARTLYRWEDRGLQLQQRIAELQKARANSHARSSATAAAASA
jgi:hypothetical protein